MATVNQHDAARNQICRWCCAKVGGKGRIATLTGQTRVQYIKHFEPIDDSDNYRPLVVCVSCKLYLGKASRGCPPKEFPSRFPWPTLPTTRFNSCTHSKTDNNGGKVCAMCTEDTRFGSRKKAPKIIRHTNVGRPLTSSISVK